MIPHHLKVGTRGAHVWPWCSRERGRMECLLLQQRPRGSPQERGFQAAYRDARKRAFLVRDGHGPELRRNSEPSISCFMGNTTFGPVRICVP